MTFRRILLLLLLFVSLTLCSEVNVFLRNDAHYLVNASTTGDKFMCSEITVSPTFVNITVTSPSIRVDGYTDGVLTESCNSTTQCTVKLFTWSGKHTFRYDISVYGGDALVLYDVTNNQCPSVGLYITGCVLGAIILCGIVVILAIVVLACLFCKKCKLCF